MHQNDQENQKMKGAVLVFTILQLVYLFFFMIEFPNSFRNAVGSHYNALDGIASWISSITMLGYCISCLVSVAQLVMRRHNFLMWFQLSGGIAIVGNFIVYIMRQIASGMDYGYYYYGDDTYYWVLFVLALFWTVSWCMYFARSSRLYSYMGNDATYLRTAFFTKNVKEPQPWKEPQAYNPFQQPGNVPPPPAHGRPAPPPVPPQPYMQHQTRPMAPPPPANPAYGGYAGTPQPPPPPAAPYQPYPAAPPAGNVPPQNPPVQQPSATPAGTPPPTTTNTADNPPQGPTQA